jgi:hypothetical protein
MLYDHKSNSVSCKYQCLGREGLRFPSSHWRGFYDGHWSWKRRKSGCSWKVKSILLEVLDWEVQGLYLHPGEEWDCCRTDSEVLGSGQVTAQHANKVCKVHNVTERYAQVMPEQSHQVFRQTVGRSPNVESLIVRKIWES